MMVMKPPQLYLHTLMRYIMINISRSRKEMKVPSNCAGVLYDVSSLIIRSMGHLC